MPLDQEFEHEEEEGGAGRDVLYWTSGRIKMARYPCRWIYFGFRYSCFHIH